jgi:RNA polymerase sigma factor (sigma-70 family)
LAAKPEAIQGQSEDPAIFDEALAFGVGLGLNEIARHELAHKEARQINPEGLDVLRALNAKLGLRIAAIDENLTGTQEIEPEKDTQLATGRPIADTAKPKVEKPHSKTSPSSRRKKAKATSTDPERDSVRAYLRQIGDYPLLTKDDEVRLSRRVMSGLQASEQLNNPDFILTPLQRRELEALAADGKTAKNDFMNSNLRLVVSIAKRHQGRGLSLLDLIQEGNLGLDRAVDKFDWHKGFKFSTYATWWIRQSIGRGIENTANTIRLPVHLGDGIKQLAKLQAKAINDASIVDIDKYIMGEMGIDGKRLAALRQVMLMQPISLDRPLQDDGDADMNDMIGDIGSSEGYEEIETKVMAEDLRAVIWDICDEREGVILTMRFGLDSGVGATLEEVGKEFNLTRERIRQLEAKALAKLRSNPRAQKLRDHLNYF